MQPKSFDLIMASYVIHVNPTNLTSYFFHVFAIRLKNKKKEQNAQKFLSWLLYWTPVLFNFSLPPQKKNSKSCCTSSGSRVGHSASLTSVSAARLQIVKTFSAGGCRRSTPDQLQKLAESPPPPTPPPPKKRKKNLRCFNAKFMEKSLLLFSGNASCLRGEADSIRADRLQRALLAWVVHSLGALILALWKRAVPLDVVYFTCGVASC